MAGLGQQIRSSMSGTDSGARSWNPTSGSTSSGCPFFSAPSGASCLYFDSPSSLCQWVFSDYFSTCLSLKTLSSSLIPPLFDQLLPLSLSLCFREAIFKLYTKVAWGSATNSQGNHRILHIFKASTVIVDISQVPCVCCSR